MDDAGLIYVISRLLRIPVADPAMDMVLPAKADRLNKWFAFDSGGLPIAVEGSADGYPVSDFMATVLDDNTAGAARDTLEIDSGIEIVGNLTMEARRRYIVTSKAEVTLPASAVIGDRIFLECAAYTKIKQSSADHVISWRDSLFTTKGINGYLQLMPGDSARFIYRGQGFAWQAPLKIANPATLPDGTACGAAWSPDGRYLAVAHLATPFVTIYDWITGSPVKISDPATLPYGNGQACAWSPDGRYLPIPSTTTSFMIIYQRTGRAIIKISDPATIPTGTGHSPAWSPDGRYLAVPHDTTPFLSIYDLRVSANNAWLVDIATRNGQVAGHQSELEYRFK
jgi:WD40 repeat protein